MTKKIILAAFVAAMALTSCHKDPTPTPDPEPQIAIYDLSGRQVMSFHGQAKQWNAINVNSLTDGVYFIRFLTTDNQSSVSKFIKQ